MALCYDDTNVRLHGYVDFDFADDVNSWRSTTGYGFTLRIGAMNWVSMLQKMVTLSTIEAKYIAATEACKELIRLKDFLKELGKEQ